MHSVNERTELTTRSCAHQYGHEWDDAVELATWSLNTHAIDGTSISPYEMVHGEKPKGPADMMALDNPV